MYEYRISEVHHKTARYLQEHLARPQQYDQRRTFMERLVRMVNTSHRTRALHYKDT